jgi:hypothetical protein
MGDPEAHRVWPHRGMACRSIRPVLPRALQSVSEFSPALRCSGSGDRRERETEAGVSLVCDALGDSAASTRSGRVPPLRLNPGAVGGHCGGEIGYPSGGRNAGRQEKAVGQFASPTNGMNGEGGGNDGPWKTRKTKPRFPSFPTALGNRCAIPTLPPPRRLLVCYLKSKEKETELRIAWLPPSGSSFNEKMLRGPSGFML